MRFGFVTCVQLGLSCMEAIYEAGAHLDLAITLDDHKAIGKSGRVFLDQFCSLRSIPLLKVGNINDAHSASAISSANLDWLFIIGWSQIAGPEVLCSTKNGALGIHPTLLPEGRGRAAIPWAIIKGLPLTGVTLFKLDAGVDTGPIASQVEIPLNPEITAADLYHQVNQAHVLLVQRAIQQLSEGKFTLTAQDERRASVWPRRSPDEGRIDLTGSVRDAERLVRAVTHPYPGAFFFEGNDRIVVWKASICYSKPDSKHIAMFDGYLKLEEWQRL